MLKKSILAVFVVSAMTLSANAQVKKNTPVADATNKTNDKVNDASKKSTDKINDAGTNVSDAANEVNSKRAFYYFPEYTVFYNIKTSEYTYEFGNDSWKTSKDLPVALKAAATTSNKIMITPDTEHPWKEADKYRKQYPAKK
jgi:hypothetical protein